jgi:hypothetical protein
LISTPSPRRLFLLVLAAALLLQTAWILALPAFGGIDEFDHVYKAEAVAHGQLLDNGAPENGRGGLVEVPEDVVAAASAVCGSYDYTGPDNCNAVEHLSGDTVTVASGAATYNPTYYAVVGLMAQPFSGAATDFAIRAYTALLAALLLAWAAVVTSGWARNGWPLLALLVSATPVLIYSTTIASPNGVGYAAGCLLWAAGLGLVEQPGRPRVAALTTAAVTMMVTHSTGVMWLAFVVAIIALLQPLSRWRALFRSSPRALTGAGAIIGLGAAACVAWILLAKTNVTALTYTSSGPDHLTPGDLVIGQVAWALQTIGAFPLRNEPAPAVVYVLWLVPFVFLLIAGIRSASSRVRLAALVMLILWVVVPLTLTVLSFDAEGLAWQGRYALALAVGFPALAGLALSRATRGPRAIHCVLAVALCALAQTISCLRVAWTQGSMDLSPSLAGSGPVALVLIAALALAGSMLPLLLVRRESLARTPTGPVPSRSVAEV